MWRHVTDVRLSHCGDANGLHVVSIAEQCRIALQQVLQLPCLSALTLVGLTIGEDERAQNELFNAISEQLQALLLFQSSRCLMSKCVPTLVQLRVLVLDLLGRSFRSRNCITFILLAKQPNCRILKLDWCCAG